MSLFQEGEFTGHSGGQLKWKIECDALEVDDWKCLATMILDYEKRPFQAAIGIPRGGVMLGSFLALLTYPTLLRPSPVILTP